MEPPKSVKVTIIWKAGNAVAFLTIHAMVIPIFPATPGKIRSPLKWIPFALNFDGKRFTMWHEKLNLVG